MIRRFRSEDAHAVAELQVRAWRWAYADFVDEDRMPTVERREEALRGAAELEAWVWDQDGLVVGVVAIAGDEIQLLYVDPPAQGAGVGDALLEHASGELLGAGRRSAFLWIFEANGHGRLFYERRGWEADGERAQPWPGVHAVRYRRDLV